MPGIIVTPGNPIFPHAPAAAGVLRFPVTPKAGKKRKWMQWHTAPRAAAADDAIHVETIHGDFYTGAFELWCRKGVSPSTFLARGLRYAADGEYEATGTDQWATVAAVSFNLTPWDEEAVTTIDLGTIVAERHWIIHDTGFPPRNFYNIHVEQSYEADLVANGGEDYRVGVVMGNVIGPDVDTGWTNAVRGQIEVAPGFFSSAKTLLMALTIPDGAGGRETAELVTIRLRFTGTMETSEATAEAGELFDPTEEDLAGLEKQIVSSAPQWNEVLIGTAPVAGGLVVAKPDIPHESYARSANKRAGTIIITS